MAQNITIYLDGPRTCDDAYSLYSRCRQIDVGPIPEMTLAQRAAMYLLPYGAIFETYIYMVHIFECLVLCACECVRVVAVVIYIYSHILHGSLAGPYQVRYAYALAVGSCSTRALTVWGSACAPLRPERRVTGVNSANAATPTRRHGCARSHHDSNPASPPPGRVSSAEHLWWRRRAYADIYPHQTLFA